MKRLRLIMISCLLAFLLLLGWSGSRFYHAFRQQERNQSLGQAVQKRDRNAILRLLAQGAEPQSPAQSPHLSLWQLVRQMIHPAKRKTGVTIFQFYMKQVWTNDTNTDTKEDAEVMRAFLEHGADPNTQDKDFGPILDQALEDERNRTAELLVRYGADVNAPWLGNSTPLMEVKDVVLAHELLKRGANVNARNEYGFTPLLYANNSALAELLLAHGADVNALTPDEHNTALMSACQNANTNLVKTLLEHGADASIGDKDGWTPLMLAVAYLEDAEQARPYRIITRLLLAHGANLNIQNKEGDTALMQAVTPGQLVLLGGKSPPRLLKPNPDALRLLLARHARTDIRNKAGKTALQIAEKAGYKDFVRMLRQAGAKQ